MLPTEKIKCFVVIISYLCSFRQTRLCRLIKTKIVLHKPFSVLRLSICHRYNIHEVSVKQYTSKVTPNLCDPYDKKTKFILAQLSGRGKFVKVNRMGHAVSGSPIWRLILKSMKYSPNIKHDTLQAYQRKYPQAYQHKYITFKRTHVLRQSYCKHIRLNFNLKYYDGRYDVVYFTSRCFILNQTNT